MSLDALKAKETRHLKKMQGLENSALLFTASKLSEEIKARLTTSSAIPNKTTLGFAEVFTASMVLAWLYGQKHVIDALEMTVNLASDDVMVEFTDAIDHLKSQIPLDSKTYQQLEANLKLRAFTMAAVVGEESLQRVKQTYTDALVSGASKSEVMQNIDSLLARAGVSESNPYYLELHYRNNMMSAYNTGRWTQVEHNELVEYLMYSSILDDGTTKLCKHLNDTVKPKGDPFWQQYYPPNHHKCRAIVMAVAGTMYDGLPQSIKTHSSKVTTAKLKDDATFKKEHQFKGSPTNTLKRIPAGLMDKARELGLEGQIVAQTFKQNKTAIQSTFTALQSKTLTDKQVEKVAKQESTLKGKEDTIKDLSLTDETYYGLHRLTTGDTVAVLHLVRWMEANQAIVTRTGAFDEKVQAVKAMTKAEVLALVKGIERL